MIIQGSRLYEGGGRWGVAQRCNCHPILDAIASLIEAQRIDLAMLLIKQELNSQTWPTLPRSKVGSVQGD